MPGEISPQIAVTNTLSSNPPLQTLGFASSQPESQPGSNGTAVSTSRIGEPLEHDRDACAQEIENSLTTNTTTNRQAGPELQALRTAIQRGDIAAVQEAIPRVENINAAGEQGENLLIIAAECGEAAIVELLRQSGAHLKGYEDLANRSLRAAASEGLHGKVSAWIAAGADPNTTNSNGATAMMIAAQKGHVDAVKKFIAAGARVDAVNLQGHNALTLAARQGHVRTVEYLVESGAELQENQFSSLTQVLKNAIDTGKWNVAVALILSGVDMLASYATDVTSPTLYRYALGSHGMSGAIIAAGFHLVKALKAISGAQGADRTGRVLEALRARLDCSLVYAVNIEKKELVVALRAEGAELPRVCKPDAERALRDAVREQRVEEVSAWIAAGVDVDSVNEDQVSSLMYAVVAGNTTSTRLLINAGADLELTDRDGETALIYAAKSGQVEAAKILLDHGASITPRDNTGNQAKDWALFCNHFGVTDALISRGVQLTAEETTLLMHRMAAFLPARSDSPAMHFLRITQFALDHGWPHLAEALQPKRVILSTI